MITAFELFIVGAVLFVLLGVILFTLQSEPHNKFDERYIEDDARNAGVPRLGASANGRNAPEPVDLAKANAVSSILRDRDATTLSTMHGHMARPLK